MSKIQFLQQAKFATSKYLSLKEYYDKRNKVLIVRDTGGIGDILMSRMIFEDFKTVNPNSIVYFACPLKYHDLVKDHPYIDFVIDSQNYNLADYIITYNITAACGQYEKSIAPMSDLNRSDIWGNHCGIRLTNHNMHLTIDDDVQLKYKDHLDSLSNNKPVVLFSPLSAIKSKDLDVTQTQEVIDELELNGYTVICLNKETIKYITAPTIVTNSFLDFLGYIKAADYIISVDTATFHAAGGLDKPTVGIFSWADGKAYGKWYKKWILVQRHRDNGNWSCGPCYMWNTCPKVQDQSRKPCITEITSTEIIEAAMKLFNTYPLISN